MPPVNKSNTNSAERMRAAREMMQWGLVMYQTVIGASLAVWLAPLIFLEVNLLLLKKHQDVYPAMRTRSRYRLIAAYF